MAETNCTTSTNDGSSGEDVSGLRRDLKELLDHQSRLVKQMDNLTVLLSKLFHTQDRANTLDPPLTERDLVQWSTESCNMPAEQPESVADAQRPTAPYPQFNAGHRLCCVSELLEMILLELRSEDILFAQRASRQFRRVIAQSHPIQQRLFLSALPTDAASAGVILNPILTKKHTLPHVPLFFDKHNMTMAYCHSKSRQRVYCTSAAVVRDEATEVEWIDLRLTDSFFPTSNFFYGEPRQGPFGAGSWKHMCLSQPPCEVKWHLGMADKTNRMFEHRFCGHASSKSTMDAFLESFAASVVEDGGKHERPRHERYL